MMISAASRKPAAFASSGRRSSVRVTMGLHTNHILISTSLQNIDIEVDQLSGKSKWQAGNKQRRAHPMPKEMKRMPQRGEKMSGHTHLRCTNPAPSPPAQLPSRAHTCNTMPIGLLTTSQSSWLIRQLECIMIGEMWQCEYCMTARNRKCSAKFEYRPEGCSRAEKPKTMAHSVVARIL